MRSGRRMASLAAAGLAAAACSSTIGGSGGTPGSGASLMFQGQIQPLSSVSYDTGLQPPGSPAQAQLKVSGNGNITVTAAAKVQGTEVVPTQGSGTVTLDLHFLLAGHLKVDTALESYDGDIPGLMNVDIAAQGNTTFEPFLIGTGTANVTAPIPATQLPDIPLGMIPGKLQIAIADGSVLNTSYQGVCVGVAGGVASYQGEATTSGSLKLKPTIVLDAPLSKSIPLPDVTVDIPGVTLPVDLATQPATGAADAQQGMCPGNAGEAGPDGTTPTPDDGGTTPAPDGGTTSDGSPSDGTFSDNAVFDATPDGSVDGGSCYQNTPFTPRPWQPPTPLHQNVCTSTQLSAYVSCLTSPTGDCSAFRGDPTNAGCLSCMETDQLSSMLGPVITSGGAPIDVNWGGCVADIDGNTGSGSCGNEIESFNDCILTECAMCFDQGTPPDACIAAAEGSGGQCAPYYAPSCDSEIGDGGLADACNDFNGLLTMWCGP